jgi:probable F420-dependent oxidoreductase
MLLGVHPVNFGPESHNPAWVKYLAATAEELGVESLWAADHIIMPKSVVSRYPYSEDGKLIFDSEYPMGEPIVWAAFAAACTTRLKIGFAAMVAPIRNTIILAKELACLDRLAEGRILAGVGVGWQREEATLVGTGWEDRGARMDAMIEAMRCLWRDSPASYEGYGVSFTDVISRPGPHGKTVALHIAGSSKPAARRAGRVGDGFLPINNTSLESSIKLMRQSAIEAGRNPDTIEITVAAQPRQLSRELLDDWTKLGINRVILPLPGDRSPESVRSRLTSYIAQFGD